MIQEILNRLGLSDGMDTSLQSRRKHFRRLGSQARGVQADVIVGDRVYSVKDWSLGGVFFETQPDPRLTQGDTVEIKLKFRLPHETVEVHNRARVVRATKRGIATAFDELQPDARRMFERVIDGMNAISFADSQVA